jgi:CRISPR-associated protein Csb2
VVSIAIRFLAGRYHATPWDKHVNEGIPEWPPAPFRIMRAIAAASYRLQPPPVRTELEALLEALAGEPEYILSATTSAHTRHYMPIGGGKTTKVFDSFVAVGEGAGNRGGEIVVSWPEVVLADPLVRLLERLLGCLGYLGRAESWVECRLAPPQSGPPTARVLGPHEQAEHETHLLACESPSEYDAWRRGFLAAAPKAKPPESLWDILHTDTGTLQKEGWSAPPGTRWVRYGLNLPSGRRNSLVGRDSRSAALPTLARYALHSAVLPSIFEAVAIGERMRQALMAHSRDDAGISHWMFSGRDSYGSPLTGHRHAFFLPEDADADGFIDHVLVWGREGFDGRCQRALRSLERLWGSSGYDLWLVLTNIGMDEEFENSSNTVRPGFSPSIGPSRHWRSVTPFVATRHAKLRRGIWVDTPELQLEQSLAHLGLRSVRITPLTKDRLQGASSNWHRFRRRRLGGDGSRADGQGHGFEVEFAEPVNGPVVAGYGAHFGLGRFEPIRTRT